MAVDINRMCELALYRVQFAVASMAFAATRDLVTDDRLRSAALMDLQEANSLLESAELDAQMEADSRAYWEEVRVEEEARLEAEAEQRLFRDTHTWQEAVVLNYPDAASPTARAAAAIHDYFVAVDEATFAYDCARNPEGVEQAVFDGRSREARELMIAALSLLKDSQIKTVLRSNRGRDLDGSSYAATDLNEVRVWRDKYAQLTISGVEQAREAHRQARWARREEQGQGSDPFAVLH